LPVSITNRIGASRHWSNTLTSDKEGFGERSSLRAHNSEVTRTKRVAGKRGELPQPFSHILIFIFFNQK